MMPRARQAPEQPDRCAPRLAFPETGPTRASSSSWHDCVQQALRFDCSDDDHGKVPRRKRAEKAGRSKPSDLDEVRNQQSKRALAFAKPMWWRVQAERKVAAGHAELATCAERACRQFRQDCEAEVKLQMASIHSKQALRHDEGWSFVRSAAG